MTISLTLFLPLSLLFVFLIVIMYVCRATFLSQVLACTSLYVLRIIIIIIIIIQRGMVVGDETTFKSSKNIRSSVLGKIKAYNTCCSQAVTHPGTEQARR